MRIAKYKPFKSEFPFDQVFDKIMGTQLSELVGAEFTTSTPSANITESEEGFQIDIALPGLAKEDVAIEVIENTLIVKGNKTSASDRENYDRREFNYSSFERRFFLGDDIDEDKINAKHKNGILSVSLVKDKSKSQKKTVTIN